jgi:hypothetical protein
MHKESCKPSIVHVQKKNLLNMPQHTIPMTTSPQPTFMRLPCPPTPQPSSSSSSSTTKHTKKKSSWTTWKTWGDTLHTLRVWDPELWKKHNHTMPHIMWVITQWVWFPTSTIPQRWKVKLSELGIPAVRMALWMEWFRWSETRALRWMEAMDPSVHAVSSSMLEKGDTTDAEQSFRAWASLCARMLSEVQYAPQWMNAAAELLVKRGCYNGVLGESLRHVAGVVYDALVCMGREEDADDWLMRLSRAMGRLWPQHQEDLWTNLFHLRDVPDHRVDMAAQRVGARMYSDEHAWTAWRSGRTRASDWPVVAHHIRIVRPPQQM